MTITEKILASHAKKKEVYPGDLIVAKVDVVMGHDLSAPLAIKELERIGLRRVFDTKSVVLISDHFTPNKDVQAAEQCRIVREFAREVGIVHHYEVGEAGICHVFLPEKGLVLPGDLVVGGDSHTCTYGALGAFATGVGSTDLAAAMLTGELWFKVPESIKLIYYGKVNRWVEPKDLILYTIGDIGVDGALYKAMEFCGEVIEAMPMAGRFTMANMAVEAGAKNGIIQPDEVTEKYARERASRPFHLFRSDKGSVYSDVREYDVSKIEPQVALPSLPSNTRPVRELGDVRIDQAVIGSCTNGRIEDLRIAARILKGRKVARHVRLIVIPGSREVYLQALKEGLIEVFLDANGVVSPPTCGPCVGGHMGVLGKGEVAVSTTNRNFVGRMGHPESRVYLANVAVVASSAVKGRIVHPEEVVLSCSE